jgi:peptide/nickel transport system substrate-binding protein
LLLLVPVISFTTSGYSSFKAYGQLGGSASGGNVNSNINSVKKGAFVDQINFIHYLDENLAIQDLRADKIDTYFFNIPTSIVSDVYDDPNLKKYESTGGEDNLLNPAPAKTSATTENFNPFSIKQVAFAMNYLIDRNFVVNEILKGHGTPIVDPYGIYSPEYLNIIDTVQSFGFRHDPAIAEKMISDALIHAGATKDNGSSSKGKWMYHGKPITIKILIRSDIPDLNSIGNTIASNLEDIGFTVIRDYGDRTKSLSVVYGSDPQDLIWNVYTEATSSTAFVKYYPSNVASSYAPWDSNMPGSQNPSLWNYKNATLDTITQKLVLGNFTSENERNDLLRSAVKDGIQESVRVYIATLGQTYVATKNVKGLVNDFGAGITSKLSLIDARLEGTINNDNNGNNRASMNVGVKQIYGGAWNNVAGFRDIYSVNILNGIQDLAVFNHPYTGETIPFRTPWTAVETNGPHGAIPIADGTVIWDPLHQQWKKANDVSGGNNNNNNSSTAVSKVTYNLLYGKWHNGIMMDKNDVLYTNYFQHEWATNTGTSDKTMDSEYTSQVAPSLKFDRGIRFLSNNKLESYTDFWHFDKNEVAGLSAWWPAEPWEITAAQERLVTEGKFAFSKTDSTSKGVDWLSLIVPGHANAIKDELQKMKSERYVPITLRDTVSASEASNRYDASIKWITQHNNAIIGNGPFYLDSYNPSGGVITIKAFRDSSYPFTVGYWNKYEHPKLATIQNAANNIPRIIRIGQPHNIIINVDVDGKPSDNATLRYYLSNTDGKIVTSGVATKSTSSSNNNNVGKYIIQLSNNDTRKLSRGPNQLELFVVSFDAYKPYIITKSIIAV